MARDGALIISVWGLPTRWNRYVYTVSIGHRAFEEYMRRGLLPADFRCESCCTTHVIASYLQNAFDVHTVIFGVDTVVNPSVAGDSVREEAERLYRKWLQDLASPGGCSCCSDVDWQSVAEVSILPGIGHYYGWRFRASVDSVFVKAFYEIYSKLSGRDYSWLILDLSHGLNYVMVAVLYATIANAIIFDMEGRLIVVNSEPAAAGGPRCISDRGAGGDAQGQSIGSLNILDVSRLQKVISFVRGIAALKHLQPFSLGAVLRELEDDRSGVVSILKRDVLPFFRLLSNAIVGPTFSNSYTVDENGAEEPLQTALCRSRGWVFRNAEEVFEFRPVRNGYSNSIEYGSSNIFAVLLTASRKIVDDICRDLTANEGDRYLLKYLKNVADYQSQKSALVSNELIVRETMDDLGKLIKFLTRGAECLKRCGLALQNSQSELQISGTLFRAVLSRSRAELGKLHEVLDRCACSELEKTLQLDAAEKELERDRENVLRDPSRALRNMCAHAGLEYTVIERIYIDMQKGDIGKIAYNRKLLHTILSPTKTYST